MFDRVTALSTKEHKDLRYKYVPDYSHAAELTSAPISFSEMFQAAKYYPIVFPKGGMPAVLLGFEGKNGFVDADGQWTVPYIPSHVTRYPFILGNTDDPKAMLLMADLDAPHFKADDGERLFDEEGHYGPVLEKVRGFLKQFQDELRKSQRLTQELFDAGVMVQQQIQKGSGEQQQALLTGFYTVDQKKFDALQMRRSLTGVRVASSPGLCPPALSAQYCGNGGRQITALRL